MNITKIEASPVVSLKRRAIIALPALTLLPVLTFSRAASAEELALSTAINRAGRIRALSQRLAKAHIQVALGILPEKGQEIITTARALIASNIKDLKSTHNAAPAQFASMEADAKVLMDSVIKPPLKKSAGEISEQSDILLASAEKLTAAYEGSSKSGSAKLIGIAGRQRMLSQRVAKLYFLWNIGYTNPAISKELEKSRAEFKTALATLTNAPISTPSIKSYLELGRTQWMFLEDAITKPADAAQLRNVSTASERVLEVMNDLANEYDIALKEILGLAYVSPRYAMLDTNHG